MILSAGLGTRLRPLTNHIPKPAIPFLNVPIILYYEYLMRALSLEEVVVNTHHLPEKIRELATKFQDPSRVTFLHESPNILGSGGGIWNARSNLSGAEDFIVTNGDSVLLPDTPNLLSDFVALHQREKPLATLMVVEHEGVGRQFGGVWANAQDRVVGISKTSPGGATQGFHFIGFQMLSPRIFDYLPSGASNIFENAIVPAIKNGEKVIVYKTKSLWFETGNERDFLLSTQTALKKYWEDSSSSFSQLLTQVWNLHLKNFIVPKPGQIFRGSDVLIPPSVSFDGVVVLGDQVTLGEDIHLKNVVVMPQAIIESGTRYQDRLLF
jgi:mannose-1-phosphate guanylyltransferase